MRRSSILACAVLAGTALSAAAQSPAAAPASGAAPPAAAAQPASPGLSVEEQRAFLAAADIVDWKEASKGVTKPLKMTLTNGTLTHHAAFQRVDVRKSRAELSTGAEMNFRDYFGYNIAAHHLACLINRCDLVPAAVERKWRGESGALVWWVDDVVMDESDRLKNGIEPPESSRWVRQQYLGRLFSELTGDVDRNQTNILITSDWRLVLIDFSRAFRLHKTPRPALHTVQRVEPEVLDGLRALTKRSVEQAAGRWLGDFEIDALLARRDAIVAHLDRLIATKGHASVVYPVEMAANR